MNQCDHSNHVLLANVSWLWWTFCFIYPPLPHVWVGGGSFVCYSTGMISCYVFQFHNSYRSVLSKWEFFIKIRAAYLLSPSFITRGRIGSSKAALILIGHYSTVSSQLMQAYFFELLMKKQPWTCVCTRVLKMFSSLKWMCQELELEFTPVLSLPQRSQSCWWCANLRL